MKWHEIVSPGEPELLNRVKARHGPFFLNADERNQAKVRIGIVSTVVTYTGCYTWIAYNESPFSKAYFLFALFYFAWSWFLLAWAYWLYQAENHGRFKGLHQFTAIVSDIGSLGYGMYLGDVVGTPLLPVYLWVTLGNGIRFGNRHLYFSAVLSATCFLLVAYTSDSWGFENNMALPIGLAFGLLVVPVYVGALLNAQRATLLALDNANRIKSDFIATVNHELRTPLHGVIAAAGLLSKEQLDSRHRKLLQLIQTSANSQLTLINRMLDATRTGRAGDGDQELFEVTTLFKEIYEILDPQLRGSRVAFRIFVDSRLKPWLRGSPVRLKQIILNLCSNSLKFTQSGHVLLSVELEHMQGDRQILCIDVCDTGIGIAEREIPTIFEPFVQAHKDLPRHSGTGLGLSIVASLTKELGGSLQIQSKENVGTTIRIRLPATFVDSPLEYSDLQHVEIKLVGVNKNERESRDFAIREAICAKSRPPDDRGTNAAKTTTMYLVCNLNTKATKRQLNKLLSDRGDRGGLSPIIAVCDDSQINARMKLQALTSISDLSNLDRIMQAISIVNRLLCERGRSPSKSWEPIRPLRILVAEDNQISRIVIVEMLEAGSHLVTAVGDGKEVLDALFREVHDLVLLDVHMPGLNGLETTRLIREGERRKGLARTPVILLTADTNPQLERRATEFGADAVISKPISELTILHRVLESLLGPTISTSAESRAESHGPQSDLPIGIESVGFESGDCIDEHRVRNFLFRLRSNSRESAMSKYDLFFAEVSRLVLACELAASTTNQSGVRQCAHELAGASLVVGAIELADLSRAIIKTASFDDVRLLRPAFEKTRKRISDLINERDSVSSPDEI
jgi:two-component system sensor histidine kinase RpfC